MFLHGPSSLVTGGDSKNIEDEAYRRVCKVFCQDIKNGKKTEDIPIDFVGHSRGGYIVIQLAHRVKAGCVCCDKKYGNLNTRFIGLYDAVDMAPGYGKHDKPPRMSGGITFVVAKSFKKKDGSIGGRSRGTWRRPLPEGPRARRVFGTGALLWVRGSHSAIGGAPWQGDKPEGSTKEKDIKAAVISDQHIRRRAIAIGIKIKYKKDKDKDYGYNF